MRDVADYSHGFFALRRGFVSRVGPPAGLGVSEDTKMNRRCVESNPVSLTVRNLAQPPYHLSCRGS
jgi:hypothetical protein